MNIKLLCLLILSSFCIGSQIWAQAPDWQAPAAGQYSFSATAVMTVNYNDVADHNEDNVIAIFVNNEIRGLGVAIPVGQEVVHFVTYYSNTAGEDMQIKVYHASSGMVIHAAEALKFQPQEILGSIENPYPINLYMDFDGSFSFSGIPSFSTFGNEPFEQIDLMDYVQQQFPIPLSFSVLPNSQLSATLNGSLLSVTPQNGFSGFTSLQVSATELAGGMRTIETTISFEVIAAFDGPKWLVLMDQAIQVGQQFSAFDLPFYLKSSQSACHKYSYSPILDDQNQAAPNWDGLSANFPTTMTIIAKMQFSPSYVFRGSSDQIAVFINGSFRGRGVYVNPEGLAFITVGGTAGEQATLEFRFYDGIHQTNHSVQTNISFEAAASLGTESMPLAIDFAPFYPNINASSEVSFTMQNPNFVGTVTYSYRVEDCNFGDLLFDDTSARYCITTQSSHILTSYFDEDKDGFGSLAYLNRSCSPRAGFVSNSLDCNDRNAAINPNALEICDAQDNDCDGILDEGCAVIVVRSNNLVIQNADNTPSLNDNTDWGIVVAGVLSRKTFTIHNEGAQTLFLNGDPRIQIIGPGANKFVVSLMPAANILPGASRNFRIDFNSLQAGEFTAQVIISNSDLLATPYTFTIRATVMAPDIKVRGNGNVIQNGDMNPTFIDLTNFGNAVLNFSKTVFFYVHNEGTGQLRLTATPTVRLESFSGGNDNGFTHFSIATLPASTINPGINRALRIQFRPTTLGTHYAKVVIETNDFFNTRYEYAIMGTGLSSLMQGQNTEIGFELGEGVFAEEVLDRSGNHESNTKQPIQVYPNPAYDHVVIPIPAYENIQDMEIFDSYGRLVDNINLSNEQNFILKVGHYAPGVYIIYFPGFPHLAARFVKLN